LTDQAGKVSVGAEGSFEVAGARRGELEFPDSDGIMQSFMEGKTFQLGTDDGSQFEVRLDSVSTSARPGFSRAEFAAV
jgi:hypothetical protein